MKRQTYDLEERLLEYSVRIIRIVGGNRRVNQDFRCEYQNI